MIKFSIITVTLNNLSGLKRTYDSITAQSETGYEWIVIDGGSDDGSVDFLKTTKALFTSEPDHGIYDAMNKGIEKSSGMYLIFMNAGDLFFESKTLQHIPDGFDFIFGDAIEDGHVKKSRPIKNFTQHMITHHQAMFYKRKILDSLRYDLKYAIASDFKFTAEFLQRSKKVKYIPKPICIFETGGVSQTRTKIGRDEQFEIRKELQLVSPLHNYMIYVTQFFSIALRTFFPNFYWRMKARGSSDNTANDSAQNQNQRSHPKTPV